MKLLIVLSLFTFNWVNLFSQELNECGIKSYTDEYTKKKVIESDFINTQYGPTYLLSKKNSIVSLFLSFENSFNPSKINKGDCIYIKFEDNSVNKFYFQSDSYPSISNNGNSSNSILFNLQGANLVKFKTKRITGIKCDNLVYELTEVEGVNFINYLNCLIRTK